MAKKVKTETKSKSKRSGLHFPVGRIHKILKDGNYSPRLSSSASVYLAALLEYLVAEILELACEACEQNKTQRLKPRHLLLAIRKDEELDKMLHGVTISCAGVVSGIHPELLPKKTSKKNEVTT